MMSIDSLTKLIALIFLSVLGLGSGVLLAICILHPGVNSGVVGALGTILGSSVTFFAKASGVVDGASIASTAQGAMQDAINAVPARPVAASDTQKVG